jgi:tetratricopeptide (TPR) repeat protein
MKIVFVFIFLTGLCLLQLGCLGGNAGNASRTNDVRPATVDPTPDVESTPLPQFTDPETAFAEGNKLFDENKNELAIEAYKQATALNPELAEAWFKLGIAYSLVEKEREIEAVNSQEVTDTPTPTPTPRSKKGKKDQVVRTKDSEKAFEKAVAAYKKILAKNPKDDLSHYNLGRTYNKLDEDDDALKSLREAVKLVPDSLEYQIELGAILNKLAQYDESVRVLKKAVELDPENSEAVELLEKAEAGKKRINFGITPKPPQPQQTGKAPKKTVTPEESEMPATPSTGAPVTPNYENRNRKPANIPARAKDQDARSPRSDHRSAGAGSADEYRPERFLNVVVSEIGE